MADIVVQASFNSGEWSPNLYARVDIAKYRSGAALLENFFVDYRGGASTRPGSKYVIQAYKSATAVRLITFQAAFNVGYAMEFGDHYIRFHYQGAPILESSFNITGITRANPAVVTVTGNNFATGDWVFITDVAGMTQIDGRFFSVLNVSGAAVTLGDLNGNNLDSTAFSAYTSGGTAARVYTLTSPFAAADLALVKFAQIQNEMVLVHPSYAPQLLTLLAPNNWTIAAITFGSSASVPTGVSVSSTLGGGTVNYSYQVTSIDSAGQESEPSAAAPLGGKSDIAANLGSNKITWTAAPGAVAYNVYESSVSFFGVVPTGVSYGFIGTCKDTTFIDTNIIPNFSETPPVGYDPFTGSGVASVAVAVAGTYTTVPTAITSGGAPSVPATLQPVLGVTATPTITTAGTGYAVNDTINFGNSLVLTVTTIGAGGAITAWSVAGAGSITSGSTPSNPIDQVSTTGTGTGAQATATWGVAQVLVLTKGAGYNATPTIVFGAGAATATATLGPSSAGNPGAASFFQQRLVLAAPSGAPSTFFMSQPGLYFNFDITDPVQADNSITETLVSRTAEQIKAIVSSTSGMLVLTDQGSWLINGGSSGSAVSPSAIVASRQSNFGANDVPPIVANYDVLYVSAKGSAVRDLAYNIYFNVFTGSDISITASHLLFGYTINEWAWAEAPFYVVWAVRSDGVMLTLTFLKEQEFIGWTHQITAGLYKSVCAVTESTSAAGNVDAVYTVVHRTVNGNIVQYIERISDRVFPNGLSSAWCVDAGIQYNGTAALTFTGAEHLAALSVTGLATDNLGNVTIITPFTMPTSGIFTLPAPGGGATGYTTVTVGLRFTCKLQTLALDIGQPAIQGKLKKLPFVDVRVKDTASIQIGGDFSHLVTMKDTVPGAVSSMETGLNTQTQSGLYSGDARTFLDPSYNVFGQFCIEQFNPYPATVLGVFPAIALGDTDVGNG